MFDYLISNLTPPKVNIPHFYPESSLVSIFQNYLVVGEARRQN